MEVIEVVDSAIKIGLGALISGLATYLVAKTNHSAALKKDLATHKISMLNEAAELAERFFYYNSKRLNLLNGMARAGKNAGQPLASIQIEAIRKIEEELSDVLAARNKASAKLHLLRLMDAEAALRAYGEVSTEIRTIVNYNKTLPTEEQLVDFGKRLVEKKNLYYKELGRGFDMIA